MLFPELVVIGDVMLAFYTTMKFPEMVQNLSSPYLDVVNWTLLDTLSTFVEVIAGVGMGTLLYVCSMLGTPVDPRLPPVWVVGEGAADVAMPCPAVVLKFVQFQVAGAIVAVFAEVVG